MEAQCSSPYTGPLQQPWYKGRGCFLDPPKVEYVCGRWRLQVWNSRGPGPGHATREELFSASRGDIEPLTRVYKDYIEDIIDSVFAGAEPRGRIAGLILEPGGFPEGHVARWTNEILVLGLVIVKMDSSPGTSKLVSAISHSRLPSKRLGMPLHTGSTDNCGLYASLKVNFTHVKGCQLWTADVLKSCGFASMICAAGRKWGLTQITRSLITLSSDLHMHSFPTKHRCRQASDTESRLEWSCSKQSFGSPFLIQDLCSLSNSAFARAESASSVALARRVCCFGSGLEGASVFGERSSARFSVPASWPLSA
jgi:hypothetical protein